MIKQQQIYDAYVQKKENSYKSKKQRSEEAKIRARIKQLEENIDNCQNEMDSLQEELTKEEVYSDFQLMNEKCLRIEELKNQIEQDFEELVELSE
jgi:ATP-binding cassette subfamily F protein 3